MNIADFQDLLDRLGEDVTAWPAPQQQAAADLLASSEQARALLEEARLLRRALAAAPVRAPAGLTDRVMQAVRQTATGTIEGASGTLVKSESLPAATEKLTAEDRKRLAETKSE